MRLTVLGGCGGWPAAGLACGGYLVEHDGFRLLIDPGYAIVPRLLEVADATPRRDRRRLPGPGHRARSPVRMSR